MPAFSAKDIIPFDAFKTYVERDYVLNDTIEFALFDMSELKFINDSSDINLKTNFDDELSNPTSPSKDSDTTNQTNDATITDPRKISALNVTKAELQDLPSMFYRSLKTAIIENKVPVTLYSAESPSYSKPLRLFVKLKHIHLKSHQQQKDGSSLQPVSLRIYGQIKDKTEDATIMKFYDSFESSFVLDSANAKAAFEQISAGLMNDLALYLKTKY